jgi:hypothetical protein
VEPQLKKETPIQIEKEYPMPKSTKKRDFTGQKFGPFTVTTLTSRKRYWNMKCDRGHVTTRRIDIVQRTRPESLVCLDCERGRPAGLTAEQAQALELLSKTVAFAVKVIETTLPVLTA